MEFSKKYKIILFLAVSAGNLVVFSYIISNQDNYTGTLTRRVGENVEYVNRSSVSGGRQLETTPPRQLFDIGLELDDAVIVGAKDLVARVMFTSFGTQATPVELTFTINKAGTEVYSEKDRIVVETERVLTKKFEQLDLPSGKYTLVLKTLYNVDVEDEFRQDFTIEKPLSWLTSAWFWIPALVILALAIYVIYKKIPIFGPPTSR